MKAIIDGKRYDTETAERIAHWGSGHNCGDFHCCDESLYKTKSDVFFLHGSGGALSKYSQSVGNNRGGSEQIIPMTDGEARQWLEEHDCTEALEKYFANDIQDA